jgi:hypothetical protein
MPPAGQENAHGSARTATASGAAASPVRPAARVPGRAGRAGRAAEGRRRQRGFGRTWQAWGSDQQKNRDRSRPKPRTDIPGQSLACAAGDVSPWPFGHERAENTAVSSTPGAKPPRLPLGLSIVPRAKSDGRRWSRPVMMRPNRSRETTPAPPPQLSPRPATYLGTVLWGIAPAHRPRCITTSLPYISAAKDCNSLLSVFLHTGKFPIPPRT